MAFFPPSFLIAIAASPPVEVTVPAISAAVVRHTGHMGYLLTCGWLTRCGALRGVLGLAANALVHRSPAFVHPCLVLVGDEA